MIATLSWRVVLAAACVCALAPVGWVPAQTHPVAVT
jgi:hypothetical protein